jgi:hypothetical protein
MAQRIPYNVPVTTQFPATPAIPTRRFNSQRFNQLVRAGFQVYGTPFSSQANFALASVWTGLIAATDATKMLISPPFSNSKLMPSKPIMTNPDSNNSYRGEPVYFGEGTAEFTAAFNDVDAAVIDAFFTVVSPLSMNNLGSLANSLVWYPCNNDGDLFSTPTWGGLPALAVAPRSRGSEGLNTSDITGFSLYLPPNWDGGSTLPTPTPFNPLTAGVFDMRSLSW